MMLIAIGSGYAWWTSTAEQSGINQIQSDCLKISYTDDNPIKLDTTYPLTDKEGEALTPYTFTIQNTCSNAIDYTINLGISDTNTLNDEYVAVKLNDNTKRILDSLKQTKIKNYNKSYELATGILNGSESKEFSLRLWMDEHVTLSDDAINKTFSSKVVVEATLNTLAKVYTDDELNGADPVLKDNLIPVKINETDGTVTKANIEEEWYNYKNKEWANAVILKDNGTIEEDGTIKEESIESYFVWIPKYKYKIFNMGEYNGLSEGAYEEKSQEIEIEFGIYDTVNNTIECTTPPSGENGSCAVDKWMTPSAFTSFATNGFWVGKFETGYDGATNDTFATGTTCKNEVNVTNVSKIIIKPNSYSWRCINMANMYKNSYNYQRDLDSHMMKNTEWGAVAYLSHSKYGTCDSGKCTEIRLNNNTNYITGYAAVNQPVGGLDVYKEYIGTTPGIDNDKTYNYKNKKSTIASTTGNYSGIYDLSGDCWEIVMGVTTSATSAKDATLENIQLGTSGLTKDDIKDRKYVDLYTSGTYLQYNRRILGDATGEMGTFRLSPEKSGRIRGSWYNDLGSQIVSNSSFIRGGSFGQGVEGGSFEFSMGVYIRNDFSFRIVLTP